MTWQAITKKCLSNISFHVIETHCVKFYHPQRRSGELLRLCKSNECTCAEGKNTFTILHSRPFARGSLNKITL